MAFDTKILIDKVKNLRNKVDGVNFADALVGAINTGNALMQRRIFIDNVDIENNSFGIYIGAKRFSRASTIKRLIGKASRTDRVRIKRNAGIALTPYQRKRANKGRQIVKKDLEFSGGVRRSLEVEIINERSVALQFNNLQSAKIARGQENQITNIRNGLPGVTTGDGIKIFAFNDNEHNETVRQGRLLINQIINK